MFENVVCQMFFILSRPQCVKKFISLAKSQYRGKHTQDAITPYRDTAVSTLLRLEPLGQVYKH